MDHIGIFRTDRFTGSITAPWYTNPCRAWMIFRPWLDRIVHFPVEIFDEAYCRIPLEWIKGEEDALEGLFERLLRRRARVPDLIADCHAAKPAWFPQWR